MQTQQKSQNTPNREDLYKQYALLSQSIQYFDMVIAAVLLNYFPLVHQQYQLGRYLRGETDEVDDRSYFPYQMSAALLILGAAAYFAQVSQSALDTPQTNPLIADTLQLNNMINSLILIAALIRIVSLLEAETAFEQAKNPTAQQAEAEAVLDSTDAII